MSEMKLAPTLAELDSAPAITVEGISVSINKSEDDPQEIVQAARNLSRVAIEFSVTTTQFAKNIRRIMRSLFPYILLDKGYIIVNHRGRNKLVDIRRIRRGKA